MKKFYILTVLFALLGISNVWALDERTKVNVDGTWYSLYSTDEYYWENGMFSDKGTREKEFPVISPTDGNVSFQWRKSQSGTPGTYNGYQLDVSYSLNGSDFTGETRVVESKISEKWEDWKSETKEIVGSSNAVKVKFSFATCTRTNYYKNVQIRMAKHILLADGTNAGTISANGTLNATAVGSTSAAYHINLRSFLMEGTQIRYVSDNAEFHFGENATSKTFDVKANSCAFAGGTADCAATNTALGNPDNYEVNVYFSPVTNKKGSSSATITIYDGETARATINLTAKVIPTYYFKATAAFHGVESADVKASFDKNVFEGVSAIGSAVAANADAASTTKTAYYSAPASIGNYTFKGWFDNEECTGESLSASVVYAATITSNSIYEENPTETKLYAKYTEVREAKFFGDEENDVKIDSVYVVEYLSTYPDVASSDNTTSFWYEILNNSPEDGLNREGSTHPNEIITYDPETREVIARNVGTATIVFHQEAVPSLEMEAVQKSYTFNVAKRENAIYVKGVTEFSETILPAAVIEDVVFTAENEDYDISPINWAIAEGAEVAVYNPENKTITANYRVGTASWTLSQAENYKYYAANATFSVTVKRAEEANDCYVLDAPSLEEWNTIDKVDYSFAEAGAVLSFDTRRVALLGFSNSTNYYVRWSADNSNWTDIAKLDLQDEGENAWYHFDFEIPEDARYVRFETTTGATGYKSIQNVYVTRKTYLEVTAGAIEVIPTEEGVGQLTVDYSLANGGDLKIVSDNDQFTFEPATIADVDCKSGVANVKVIYAPQEEEKNDIANVVIYNGVYYKELQIVAQVSKITPVITWENLDMKVNDSVELAATCDQPEAEIQYEIVGETDVVRIENGKIYATNGGDAQVRAFIESSAKFNAAEKTINVHVITTGKQTITWEQELHDVKTGDIVELTATASSGLTVTYTSSDENIAKIEDGKLVAVAPGMVTITATQDGNEEFEAAEPVVRVININDPEDTREEQSIIWDDDLPMLGYNDPDYQIIASATSALEVSFISSDSTIAYVDENGWIIINHRPGVVTITAIQEGDETFKPAEPISKTLHVLDTPSAIDNEQTRVKAVKILRDGQVLILRDGRVYSINGSLVMIE